MRRLSVLGAFAALVMAGGANAVTVPGTGGFVTIGNDLTSAADLGRMWQSAQGLGAKSYIPSTTTMGQATSAGIRVAGAATATIGGRSVPITLISRLPVTTVVQAARGVVAMNPATAAVTILGFAAMQGWLTPAGLQWNPDRVTGVEYPFLELPKPVCDQSGCRYPQFEAAFGNTPWSGSIEQACSLALGWVNGRKNNPADVCTQSGCTTSGFSYSCTGPGGAYGSTTPMAVRYVDAGGEAPRRLVSWSEAEGILSDTATRDYSGVDWKGITQQLLDLGARFPADALKDGTVSGPASQPGSRTETVGKRNPSDPASETVRTTTTTTHNYTYNNTTINYSTTVRTEVRNLNGDLLEEGGSEEENPEEQVAQDTDLPDVPDFYEQKYKDGFKGVWAKNSAAFHATSLGTFAMKMMPSGLGAGSCPQWSITLDVGIFDGGMHDVSVPCEIWQACKVLVLLGALLLARRLVFGG